MAWTLTITPSTDVEILGKRHLTLKLDFICDGAALTQTALSTFTGWSGLNDEQRMGVTYGRLVSLTTVPGTGATLPDLTYTVDLYTGLGAVMLALTARSVTVVEVAYPSATSEIAPNMQGIPSIAVGDLGTSGDTTTIYLEVAWGAIKTR